MAVAMRREARMEGMRPISALLLDDNAFDRRRILRMSERMDLPIEVEEVSTLSAMTETLARKRFDLMLIDYRLSEGDGFGALELARASEPNAVAAKIMISGASEIGVAVSALKHGCTDFLCKQDLSAEVLRRAILQALPQEPPAPAPDLQQEVERAMIAALRAPALREELRPVLRACLDEAVQRSGFGGAAASGELRRYLDDFDEELRLSAPTVFQFPRG